MNLKTSKDSFPKCPSLETQKKKQGKSRKEKGSGKSYQPNTTKTFLTFIAFTELPKVSGTLKVWNKLAK